MHSHKAKYVRTNCVESSFFHVQPANLLWMLFHFQHVTLKEATVVRINLYVLSWVLTSFGGLKTKIFASMFLGV